MPSRSEEEGLMRRPMEEKPVLELRVSSPEPTAKISDKPRLTAPEAHAIRATQLGVELTGNPETDAVLMEEAERRARGDYVQPNQTTKPVEARVEVLEIQRTVEKTYDGPVRCRRKGCDSLVKIPSAQYCWRCGEPLYDGVPRVDRKIPRAEKGKIEGEKVDINDIFEKLAPPLELDPNSFLTPDELENLSRIRRAKGIKIFKRRILGFCGRKTLKSPEELGKIFYETGMCSSPKEGEKLLPILANPVLSYSLFKELDFTKVTNMKGEEMYRVRVW